MDQRPLKIRNFYARNFANHPTAPPEDPINNARLLGEQQNPPINAVPPLANTMNPFLALMERNEEEKIAADGLLTLNQGPIDLRIKPQVDNGGNMARNVDENDPVGVALNFDQRRAIVPNHYGQAAFAGNPNFSLLRQLATNHYVQAGFDANPNLDIPQPVEAYNNAQAAVAPNPNFDQLQQLVANHYVQAGFDANPNLDIQQQFVVNRQAAWTGDIGQQAQQQQPNRIADPAPTVVVQELRQPGYGSEMGLEVAQVEGHADHNVDGRHAHHVHVAAHYDVKTEIETDTSGSPSAPDSLYDASDYEANQAYTGGISSNSDHDEQNCAYGASDDDSESLDSSNDDIPVEDSPSVSDSRNGSVSPPVDAPVVDVVNHDPAIVDGQNLHDSAIDIIPVADSRSFSDSMNGSVSPPVDDQVVDVVNNDPAIVDGQNLHDSAIDSIPVADSSSFSDSMNDSVSPPLDDPAKVNDPASLADEAPQLHLANEAIQAGHAQAIQSNNQVNDGTGEENDNNVPPNGVQAGAQVSGIAARLRDRNALKRPAVFQAGDDDDAAPAKKGRHYVDLLLYSQDGMYMVLWSSKDWNKHPTTCPIEFVDKGREVVRFDNHSTGFNVWLDETTFKDELKSVREMAKVLINKPRCSEVEHDKRKHVCEDPLFRLNKDQREEFFMTFTRFETRFWDDPYARNQIDLDQTDPDQTDPEFKRNLFSAQTENWFKWHTFSFKCFLESLDANDKGDDHHYGFQDLHNICDHMGQYDRIDDFEEEVQTQRRARDLNLA